MKTERYMKLPGAATLCAAVAALLTTGCVKGTLYHTDHPDGGKISVSASWTDRGEGIAMPDSWMISMGDYSASETNATHTPEQIFEPGTYTLAAWNNADKVTVNGTTATLASATGNWDGVGSFVTENPGWLFTSIQEVQIEKDTDYTLVAAMQQQVRELTLIIEPTGSSASRISEIDAYLTGAAGRLDFATDSYGSASNVALSFTKITSGSDAGKWSATVRLLGTAGSQQLLKGQIRFTDDTPEAVTLESDLTQALSSFNTKKNEPLTLRGTMAQTPEQIEFATVDITGWNPSGSNNVNAGL